MYKHCMYLSFERNILEQIVNGSHFNLLSCVAVYKQKEQNINLKTEVGND